MNEWCVQEVEQEDLATQVNTFNERVVCSGGCAGGPSHPGKHLAINEGVVCSGG